MATWTVLGAYVGLSALLTVWTQPACAVMTAGPREIRLTWQFVAAQPAWDERQRWLALLLPDQQTLFVSDVHVEDISGNMPGSSIYYDQFGTAQFRLNVIGPSELIDALRRSARPGTRASMVALYYRPIGRLLIVELEILSATD